MSVCIITFFKQQDGTDKRWAEQKEPIVLKSIVTVQNINVNVKLNNWIEPHNREKWYCITQSSPKARITMGGTM